MLINTTKHWLQALAGRLLRPRVADTNVTCNPTAGIGGAI